jgi:hypothetical protein
MPGSSSEGMQEGSIQLFAMPLPIAVMAGETINEV